MRIGWPFRLWCAFATVGVLVGTLFFTASLTPTLLPRTFIAQGVLAGGSFALGYAIGVFGSWLWTYLELPQLDRGIHRVFKPFVAISCALVAILSLWQATHWQNSIREVMKLEPVTSAYPLETGLIAMATFVVIVALAGLFRLTLRAVSTRVRSFLPRRVANVIGISAATVLFWSLASGVFFRLALQSADATFQKFDALLEPERAQPTDPTKTGSAASLVKWEELGRAGREFISSGPSRDQLRAFLGTDPLEPVRVYVGLRSAETAQERAELALEELKRAGGFERSVLIVVTPTGTGWIDPAAMDSVEYILSGDVASVALQYSYLSSPLSLLVHPEYGVDSARALFKEIYGHWTGLPKSSRPKLYLHGLSLGAKNSEQSKELFEVLADPFNGALWSGPPYASRHWRSITAGRNAGSPAWLPLVRDGSFVRFMNQNGSMMPPGTAWGPMRIVYLQYASDPITFFDYHDLFRQPAWMMPPRGPDVSPQLRWYPLVTALQLAMDTTTATTAPVGFGHVFAPAHYVDAWLDVTGVRTLSPADVERLKHHLTERQE